MIKKIKSFKVRKNNLFFLISLAIFSLRIFFLIKNKCLFVKDYNPEKLSFDKPNNIAILNVECGNVIIELYPNISPNAVERFKTLVRSKAYDDVAFHRVIKDSLVQAGDLEFGKKGNIDYGKIGTGQSGLGTINSEIDVPFDYERGSVGLARTKNIILKIVNFLSHLKMSHYMRVNIHRLEK